MSAYKCAKKQPTLKKHVLGQNEPACGKKITLQDSSFTFWLHHKNWGHLLFSGLESLQLSGCLCLVGRACNHRSMKPSKLALYMTLAVMRVQCASIQFFHTRDIQSFITGRCEINGDKIVTHQKRMITISVWSLLWLLLSANLPMGIQHEKMCWSMRH